MSIALLGQLYDDMRRIAVAGSAVAPGDFRLKKHVAALEQAGAKAPIFATIAGQVRAVVDSTEKTASQAVLELASLLNAVLYTQGETAVPGPMAAIETTELDLAGAAQISARTLKPLLEALTTTGSGRFELIKDAFERGAFKDPRLLRPSLEALDDVYGEIADFVSERVLPLYGRAILPELRKKLNIKGKSGDARRLELLHRLEPTSARPFVEQALEEGSKEVKVAAIGCLGSGPDDLNFLLEQAAGKAADIRRVALAALAEINSPLAIEALSKAINGKDLSLAAPALTKCQHPQVIELLHATIQKNVASLRETKDKKKITSLVGTLETLLETLQHRNDPGTTALLKNLFEQRGDLLKIKGDSLSGVDVNHSIASVMTTSSKESQDLLASAHAKLDDIELNFAFLAACRCWSADKVYDEFSPYLLLESKKDLGKKSAIMEGLDNLDYLFREKALPLDPKWLDLAVQIENFELIAELGRPGHEAQNAFLKKAFEATQSKKTTKKTYECQSVVSAMVKVQHPDATDCLIEAVSKADKKAFWYSYCYEWMVPDLPASAIPKLEAMIPTLPERDTNRWLDRIEQLRVKHRTPHGQESRDN